MNIKNYLKSKKGPKEKHRIIELTDEDLRANVRSKNQFGLPDFRIKREDIYRADLIMYYSTDRIFIYKNRWGPTGDCERDRTILSGFIGDMVDEIDRMRIKYRLNNIIINL